MISKQQEKDEKAKKEIDGTTMRAVMDTYVDERRLVLTLHDTEDPKYTYQSITKRVRGFPMGRKPSYKSKGDVKFLQNDICTYVDDYGMMRMLDLKKHNAYTRSVVSIAPNKKIAEW